jgi:hypothetical protein
VEYICVIHQVTGVKLMVKSFLWTIPSSSEYDIAKPINFNEVIDEFSSVKAKRNYIVNFQLFMKNLNKLYFISCLYTVNKLKF